MYHEALSASKPVSPEESSSANQGDDMEVDPALRSAVIFEATNDVAVIELFREEIMKEWTSKAESLVGSKEQLVDVASDELKTNNIRLNIPFNDYICKSHDYPDKSSVKRCKDGFQLGVWILIRQAY